MKRVTFTIDGREVAAAGGRRLLWAALDAGITIPHLCALEQMPLPFGGCRLCLVEVDGAPEPVTACSLPVASGLRVRTDTPLVRRLVRRSFELILSAHPLPCRGCHAHGHCGLQDIAAKLDLKLRHPGLETVVKKLPLDDSHPGIIFDPSFCVLCGLCVYLCNDVEKAHAIDFVRRGLDMSVGTAQGRPLALTSCTSCMRCTEVCPVGAFRRKGGGKTANRVEKRRKMG